VQGGYNSSGVPYQPGDDKGDFDYGAAVFIKGGEFDRWTLLYRTHHDWRGGVRTGAMTHGSDCTIGEVNVWNADFTELLEPLVLDTFTDADSTDIEDHTLDVAPIGGWTAELGAFEINGNTLVLVGAEPDVPKWIGSIECGAADFMVETKCIPWPGSDPGLVFRYEDTANLWLMDLFVNSDVVRLIERTAGAWTVRASAAVTITGGTAYSLRLIADRTSIVGYVDDAVRVAYTSSVHQSATRVGPRGRFIGDKWDNFAVYPRAASVYEMLGAR
jgi:hypothetical protein